MERQTFMQTQEKEKLRNKPNEMINEDIVDDTGADDQDEEDDDDTSEAEKNSGSDSEEEEEEEIKPAEPKSSPEVVRKRRTRKAD